MTERPILFNAEMVRAILDGRKTQTRRVVKPQPTTCNDERGGHWWPSNAVQSMVHVEKELQDYDGMWGGLIDTCNPFGEIGDRLWVRETFMDLSGTGVEHRNAKGKLQKYAYAAECLPGSYSDEVRKEFGLKWKPSIHMPKSASRLFLEITNIRVERLNEISKEDAKAEGFDYSTHQSAIEMGYAIGARSNFRHTWEQIYGQKVWNSNPWVWVIEFKIVEDLSNDPI